MKLKINLNILNYVIYYQRDISEGITKNEIFIGKFYEEIGKANLKISLEEYQNLLISKRLYFVFFRNDDELFCLERWKKIHKKLFDKKYSSKKLAKILNVMDELNEAPTKEFLPLKGFKC